MASLRVTISVAGMNSVTYIELQTVVIVGTTIQRNPCYGYMPPRASMRHLVTLPRFHSIHVGWNALIDGLQHVVRREPRNHFRRPKEPANDAVAIDNDGGGSIGVAATRSGVVVDQP